VVEPLLTVWRTVRDQIAGLDRCIMAAAKDDPTCLLLMTGPGVGAVIAMSFSAAVEAGLRKFLGWLSLVGEGLRGQVPNP